MSNIEISTELSSNRSFGWVQDPTNLCSLKKVVQIFDFNSDFHNDLVNNKIPNIVTKPEDIEKFLTILKTKPLKIQYKTLVGSSPKGSRSESPCDGIIQASIEGQKRPYIGDWPSDNFLRWSHACGFLKYDSQTDSFEITELGLKLSATEIDSEEEKEAFIEALISYPPVCRILQLLADGSHLTKFELGKNLGFVGEAGFTSLPQNILLISLATAETNKEKNDIRSDWDGSSDKYARTICSWLKKLGLVRQVSKIFEVKVDGKRYTEEIRQAYMITPKGLKEYRKVQGVNTANKTKKNVYWEMLCPISPDRVYIRNRRAHIIKILNDAGGTVNLKQIQEKLAKLKFNEEIDTIRDEIIGLQNIGLAIKENPSGYTLTDEVCNLVIPVNSQGNNKSQTLVLKDYCRSILEKIPHTYLSLIDLAYESDSRAFEMGIVDLFVTECGFKGKHLGGSRRPDGIIYTERLKNNYGTIIDTKAYSEGYSLPIRQADEMVRYVEDNIKRDTAINPNEWWKEFPDKIHEFSFLFVSSLFSAGFEDRLKNISQRTNVNGAAINIINTLILAEHLKKGSITHEIMLDLITTNGEVVIE